MNFVNLIFFLMRVPFAYAYDDLSDHKPATQKPKAENDRYKPANAVDREVSTCMRTTDIGSTGNVHEMWWKVDLGGVYNIYSVNILFKNYGGYELRQRGRFAGFSLYVSNDEIIEGAIRCYKDGPELPNLNFTTNCITSGRYIFFSNERLPDDTYPKEFETSNVWIELCEVLVHGCLSSGVYGSNCNFSCPINCRYNTCHIQQGTCFECKPGWTGTSCEKKCDRGWHGLNCTQQCLEHCLNNVFCNHITGQCDEGCTYGWYGQYCNETCIGHCINNATCNQETGLCDGGCDAGWSGYECNKACNNGTFGDGCFNNCSGQCMGDLPCNKRTGHCEMGCKTGYTNAFCNKSCVNSYGENCRYPCSTHCINGACDRFNGSCVSGCFDGFIGDKCSQVNESFSFNSALTSKEDNLVPITVGVVLSASAVVILAVAILVVRFKRQSKKVSKRKSLVNEQLSNIHMTPLKNPRQSKKETFSTSEVPTMQKPNNYINEPTKRGAPTNKTISVKNMKAQIANMSVNDNAGFTNEYNDIPRGELHPCLEGKKPENKAKNRYTTIFPYDHSRVLLKKSTADQWGYINANFIEDARGRPSYIATQGPKPKTIEDFWTMITQEDVSTIVCLTNLKEGAKNKCAKYWPDLNDKLQGDDITVRHLGEKVYAEHIIRRFNIHNEAKRQDRQVTMYHYTAWADHGVADPLSLVVFHRQVIRATAQSTGKYTLVHCSAGVGRTGTYIALDALYREGEKTGKINMPMYVRTMRKDRMNMIQGEDQYKLLYLALMEAFNSPLRSMTSDKFLSEYQEQNCYTNCGNVTQKMTFSTEFEELMSIRKVYSQKDYVSGRAHISANYIQSVLPVEEYMCHLSYVKGHNTYYNAVLLQTFLEKECLISAQYPLSDYAVDFLRLARDFNAGIVVFLGPLKDIDSSSVWFPTKTQTKSVGGFTVKHVSAARGSHVTLTQIVIQAKETDDLRCTVLECPTWKEGQSTGDKGVLLDVVKEVKTLKNNQEGRIIVLSSDGATRCGPFCVVYNALEQFLTDREVDIFTTARQLQVRRPEFVSTLDEYQLCHDAIAEYLLKDCVYGNA
uniref:protein-tyrosine-phosphatase n=1 Tax=Crassostrea virginica TaxID=6565 RepID=A0A8B8BRQ4_CRAVI|nr:receptor-type tyrosine-protein phosphatase alpha-like [Crassostrea virginica]